MIYPKLDAYTVGKPFPGIIITISQQEGCSIELLESLTIIMRAFELKKMR